MKHKERECSTFLSNYPLNVQRGSFWHLQMNPAPWKQCEFIPNFPETLPFHKWLPAVFNPTGSCNESQWSLFGITMVQWLVFIFAVYVLVLGLITLSQVKKSRNRRLIFK